MSKIFYVIEHEHSKAGAYLAKPTSEYLWTPVVTNALQFESREEAEKYKASSGHSNSKVTEHMWSEP